MSGDSSSRYTDTILEDCPSTTTEKDFKKIVDDVITWAYKVEGAFHRICSMISFFKLKHQMVNFDFFVQCMFRYRDYEDTI